MDRKLALVAESLDSDLSVLENYESIYRENDKGELRLYTDSTLSQITLQELEDKITSEGVHLSGPITQDARIIHIKFEKRIAPLAIIAIAIGVVIAGILGWQLFKLEPIVQVGLLIAGGLLLYMLFRRAKSVGRVR